ncbi:hypothetical protein [Caproicibacter sp.]|uniref:hypothetical protein n=1 Tax=Caproicibacter sp. TaxID=2814884 RepID=UPI003989A93D
MKKIWILAAAAAFMMTATACGAGDVGGASSGASSSQASSSSSGPTVAQSSVEDSLKGLEKYLTGNGVLSGDAAEMRSDVIGAKAGGRYQFSYNGKNNVTVELYEFDPNSVNGTAKQVLDSVKSSGQFTLMGQKITAVLSDSGKYLMIYQDTVTKDENKAYADKVTKLFKEFKNS